MNKFRSSMTRRATAMAKSAVASDEPLVIDTREELLDALTEAVRIEHVLMLQYLYAAFSIKRSTSEGLTDAQQEKTRDWERRILEIALDEMTHLGTACNLLSAVGGRPDFTRPNFPQAASPWYPFPFELAKLSDPCLVRFIRAESPPSAQAAALEGIAPDPLSFSYVGDLYRAIAAGFETIDAAFARSGDPRKRLFIGRPEAQAPTGWALNFKIFTITDVASAKAAIDYIVRQGEGTASGSEPSHYGTFRGILAELRQARQQDPSFEPARDVVSNPSTRPERDAAAGATIIAESSIAHPVAELLSHTYSTMLMMLSTYFDPAGEATEARATLQICSRGLMSGIVRPIAEVLSTLPATADDRGPRAGAPFEIYGDLGLPAYAPGRLAIIAERLEIEANECKRLAELDPGLTRLRFLAGNYASASARLASLLAGGGSIP
ncbi:MAG TPA: ferritin-like protein [Kofleriaceae bacterium]|nr:ferritin-like protein [Kofleriaceae bacterium]